MLPAWDGELCSNQIAVKNFHQWKIRCQVPHLLLGCSMVLKEVNDQFLDDEQKKVKDELNDAISSSISILDPSLRAQLTAQNQPNGRSTVFPRSEL